jgi:hypothetical protein
VNRPKLQKDAVQNLYQSIRLAFPEIEEGDK